MIQGISIAGTKTIPFECESKEDLIILAQKIKALGEAVFDMSHTGGCAEYGEALGLIIRDYSNTLLDIFDNFDSPEGIFFSHLYLNREVS